MSLDLRWPLAAIAIACTFVLVGSCTGDVGDESTGAPSTTSGNGAAGPNASSNQSVGPGPASGGNGMGGATGASTGGGPGAGGATGGGPGAGGSTGGTTGGDVYDCSAPAGGEFALKLTPVASGFNQPVLVRSELGDASRLYVMQQTGVISLVINGVPTTFLDISGIVLTQGEQGLLGFTFHPDYAQNGRFFVHYTDNNADTRLAEYARDPNNPNVALPNGTPFYFVNDPYSNHNGGTIEFGPDGMLYFQLGDGGGGGDPDENGQDIMSPMGKVLRMNVDPTAYTPAGNVPNGLPEVWDYGLRNPWRGSFDGCTGDLYIGDVGQNLYEEIDVEPPATGNRNYGWDCREGMHNYETTGCMGGFTEPVLEYTHSNGRCSVTGGYVYRGSAIPWMRGMYIYGDYCTGDIWTTTVNVANNTATTPVNRTNDLGSGGKPISSFGQDASGEVYVVDHSGTVYRIEPE